jgi:UDPglucose--hexose-1-phosphate uridylyltransferase
LDVAIIFRNHGEKAGTSLIHPHSQIVATNLVPQGIRRLEKEAERYNDRWGRCVYCDILDYEKNDGRRVVLENDSYIVFVPYAAQVPFEMWIVPTRHKADFGGITDQEKHDLAGSLQTALKKLDQKLGDPDYNYVINTASRHKFDEPHLHWHLRIRPRLTTMAGFEIGSGMNINPSLPEKDAESLR